MNEAERVIVTAVVPYGESDVIVRCFGRERGRFGAFARGARNSKRRFPGLMAPAIGTAMLAERRSGDLKDLKELDCDPRVIDLASSLRAYGFCGYAIELVERFIPEGAPLPHLFDDVCDVMLGLAKHGARAVILRAFELRLLAELGVLPDLSEVADNPGADVVAYDPHSGFLLAASQPTSVPFSEHARQAALLLLGENADGACALPVDDEVLFQVSRIFHGWLRRQHVTLRSLEVLRQL